MIKPHGLFQTWSPDEVSECMDGVGRHLSNRLWILADCLPPAGETPDTRFRRGLAKVWHMLDEEDQDDLNRIAADYWSKHGPPARAL